MFTRPISRVVPSMKIIGSCGKVLMGAYLVYNTMVMHLEMVIRLLGFQVYDCIQGMSIFDTLFPLLLHTLAYIIGLYDY